MFSPQRFSRSTIQVRVIRISMFLASSALGTLLILGTFTAANAARLYAPNFSATKIDTLIDQDGDNKADPGEMIEYAITLTSLVPTTTTGIVLDETTFLDPYVTFVDGSPNVSPLALNDTYETIGNTLLDGGASASDPAVHVLGLLANDAEFVGVTFGGGIGQTKITSHTNPTHGTLLTFDNNTGAFTYLPDVGYTGPDTFTYTLTDAGSLTDTGTVTINVSSKVWYVDSAYAGANGASDGRSTRPFTALSSLSGATGSDAAGDVIHVRERAGDYDGNMTLINNQQLIGSGVALIVGGNTLIGASSNTTLTTTVAATDSITLAQNNTVRGFSIGSTTGTKITGSSFGTATINSVSLSGAGPAVSLTTGAAAVTIDSLSSTSSVNAVNLSAVTGTFNVSAGNVSGATGAAFNLIGGTVSSTYSGDITQGNNAALVSVSGGHSTGTITFQTGTLNATNGTGLQFDNADGTYNFNATTTLNGGDAGIDILNTSTGTFSFASGTAITRANSVSGAAFDLLSSDANVTYSGSMSLGTTTGNLVAINNHDAGTITFQTGSLTKGSSTTQGINISNSGGGTINFNNPTISITMTSGNGVSLTNNGGSAINFDLSGGSGLDISTTSGTGFNASGGGTVSVTGSGNTITSGTGTALNVANTDIGSNNLVFQSISANGAVSGIVLNNTGSSGGLVVTGTGSAASGGEIQNSTGPGISLTNTANVSLAFMNVQSSGDDGINGASVTNFSTNGVNITNNGNSTTDEGIEFDNLFGTSSITNTTVSGNAHNNFDLNNSSGVLTSLNVAGSNFSSNSNANGNHGFLFDARLTAVVTAVTVSNSTFSNNKVIGMQVITGDTATISSFIVSNSIFSDTGTGNSQEISADFSTAQMSNLTYQFLNNTLTGHNSQAFNTFTGAGAGTGGTLNAIIQGNIIGSAGVPGSGSALGNGIRININGDAHAEVLVDNNTIRQTPNGRGIEAIARNGTGSLDLVVTNNTVTPNDVSGFPLAAIFAQSNCVTICNTLRADVRGNTVPSGAASGEILPTFIAVVETSTSTCEIVDNPPVPSANGTAELTESHTNSAYNNAGSASASAGCALIAGPIGSIFGPNHVLARGKSEKGLAFQTPVTFPVIVTETFSKLVSGVGKLSKPAVWTNAAATSRKPHLRSVQPAPASLILIPPAGSLSLPPNKTLTITFRVTVNDGVVNSPALPLGKTSISNWGDISCDECSSSIFTDDPDTAAPNDPTLTPLDRPDATITSITRTTPSGSLTNASSVTWTVTFNTLEPTSPDGLLGLEPDNFSLLQGSGLSGASITDVSAVGGTPSNVWTVTADTGSNDGTLGLRLNDDDGLSHDITTSLPFDGQSYTIDKTAPTVTSFMRETPSGQFTNADTLTFRAAFSEQITGWDTGDFAVNGGTGIMVTNVTQFTVLHYDVTISGGDLANFNGTVGLNFNSPVTITDLAGNALAGTEPSPDQTYTVDNAAPETAIDTAPPDPDNDSTPTFTFSGDDGAGSGVASFQCKVDSASYAACTSPFTVSPALADGSRTFYVYATDNAGNADSTPATYTWQLDTLPPPAPVTVTPANGSSINDSTPTVSGTAEADSTVTVYFDNSPTGTTTANGSGTWSFTPVSALSDGLHTVKATATDEAGNTSVDSNTNTFTVDATGPDTFIDSGPASSSSSATFTFHGTDTGGTGVAGFECQLDGGGFSSCSSPHIYNSLSDGSHTFVVRAVDNVGNVDPTPASYIWTVDTIAPDTTLTVTPPNPSASANASFSFTGNDGAGTGVDHFECQIDSGAFSTCTSSQSYLGLSDGSHTFNVRAVDMAGNADSTPASFTWVIDTTPPPAPVVVTPVDGANTTNPQPLVGGTAEADSTVTVFLDSVAAGTTTADPSGDWTFTPPSPLSDGLHTVKARATDAVGNTSVDSNTNTFTVDTTAPNTIIDTTPTDPTTSTNASFTFHGDDGSGVGITDVECKLDSGAFFDCDSLTSQAYTSLSEGSHTFQVRATDGVGNVDPTPASYTWIVDSIKPSVSSFTLKTPANSPTNADTLTFLATFSEPVNNVDMGDFTITTTSTASITGVNMVTASTYDVTVSGGNLPSYSGTVNLNLSAGPTVTDPAGNMVLVSEPATDQTYTLDNTAPTVTINQKTSAPAQPDPTGLSPINFTVIFSETVTGFTDADVTLGGSAGATTAVVTGSGPTYNVAVSGMTAIGTVMATIQSNQVTDAAGNSNIASTSSDNTVSFDNTPVTVTINQAVGQTDPDFANSATKNIHFTAVFSESVTGFTAADISFSGTTLMGTLSATVTEIAPMNGTTYDVAVKGMLPKGTVFVSIPANTATSTSRGVGNQASTSTDNNIIVDYVLVEFTSTASKDGWVLESTETSGAGGSLDAAATTSKIGDDASDRQYRSVLDFATGTLPDSAVLFSVNLRIIEHSITGSNPFTTHGLLKSEIKSGFFSTAGALQNPDFEATADKSACNFESVPEILEAVGTAYRCVLFNSAFPSINLTGSTQFKLRFATDDNDDMSADTFNFYSGDYGGTTQRPRLFVKYYVPPAP